jgi:RNA polymerase sigma-70 factor (ECF subfamily)
VLPFEDVPAPEADPDRRLDHARLEAALMRLPAEQRRVVVMHHLEDQPVEAIAASEGVAGGTIKSRLHRARARLAEWLGDR